jgi:hypothetical protein
MITNALLSAKETEKINLQSAKHTHRMEEERHEVEAFFKITKELLKRNDEPLINGNHMMKGIVAAVVIIILYCDE